MTNQSGIPGRYVDKVITAAFQFVNDDHFKNAYQYTVQRHDKTDKWFERWTFSFEEYRQVGK